MTVHDDARKAQEEHFASNETLATPEVRQITTDLYDGLDALSPEKRTLLVREVLARLHRIVKSELGGPDQMIANGLLAAAAYTVEQTREDEGYTSTGDKAVDDTLEKVHDLVVEAVKAMVPGEVLDTVNAAADRVKERVDAGEDFATAAAEEEAAMKDALRHTHNGLAQQREDSEAPSRYHGDGLYL